MTDSSSGDKRSSSETGISTDVAVAEAPALESLAQGEESHPRSRSLKKLADLLHDLAIAVVICVLLITYVVQAFRVQGMSMSPELVDGERILVNKFIYHFRPIERGDIVVFWYPDDPDVSFIKRVVGLPADRLEIIGGRVRVNGKSLNEPYVKMDNADERSYPRREVRSGHYFVMGDNRQGSNDSRTWGVVPRRYIYGRAFLRIWPLSDFGLID